MDNTFDIIIVGGGAIGCSIAIELTRTLPASVRCALITSKNLSSASQAAGAMIGAYSETTATDIISDASLEKFQLLKSAVSAWPLWLNQLEELDDTIDLKKHTLHGTLMFLNSVSGTIDQENFNATLERLDQDCADYQKFNVLELPFFNKFCQERPLESLYIPSEFSIDARVLIDKYKKIISASKSFTLIESQIDEIGTEPSGIHSLKGQSGVTFKAKHLVLAGGAHTHRLIQTHPDLNGKIVPSFAGAGSALGVSAEWTYRSGKAKVPPYLVRTPNRSFGCGLHLIPFSSPSCYVGATNYISMLPWEKTNLSDISFLSNCVMEQISGSFAWSQLESIYIGNRSISLDSFPIVGPTCISNIWVATGFGRVGLTLSPLIAKILTQQITSSQHHSPLVERYRPHRKLITSYSKKQLKELIIKNQMAAVLEHKDLSVSKIGFDLQLNSWLDAHLDYLIDNLPPGFVPGPEFFPLFEMHPKVSLEIIKSYVEIQPT